MAEAEVDFDWGWTEALNDQASFVHEALAFLFGSLAAPGSLAGAGEEWLELARAVAWSLRRALRWWSSDCARENTQELSSKFD
jgi:hypothetical protein